MNVSGGAQPRPRVPARGPVAPISTATSARACSPTSRPTPSPTRRGRRASGRTLRGTLAKPEVRGRLDLGDHRLPPARPRHRGAGARAASSRSATSGVVLHNVKVVLRRAGHAGHRRLGRARRARSQFTSLVPFEPGDVDLPLHGERLTYRSPGTFEVDDLAFDLDLQGQRRRRLRRWAARCGWSRGATCRTSRCRAWCISPRVNESSVRPFYEGQAAARGAARSISRVRTVGEGFVVQNNIAPEIHVDVVLHVGGTLSEPALAGDVRPTDGRFNLPGMRGDFDLVPNVNHVTFIATQVDRRRRDARAGRSRRRAPSPTPTAADHNVHMRIHGPMREAQIDLSTDDGLDRTQTAMLLLTGRTSTDTSQRFGTQNPTVGANINTGADVAGQLTRDTRRQPHGALHRRHLPAADRPEPPPHRRPRRVPGPHPQAHQPLRSISRPTPAGLPEPAAVGDAAARSAGCSTTSAWAGASSASPSRRSRGSRDAAHEREPRIAARLPDKKVA